MYFHISLIPRGAYFLLPLQGKQEATSGWNFTKYISDVEVNQLKVKNIHVKMGISTFKTNLTLTLSQGWWGKCYKNYLPKEEGREGEKKKQAQRASGGQDSNPGPTTW